MEKKNIEFTLEEVECIYSLIGTAYSSENFQPTEKTEQIYGRVTDILIDMMSDPKNRIRQGDVVSVKPHSRYLDNRIAGKLGVVTYIRVVGTCVLCTVVFENGRALEVNAVSLQLENDVPAEKVKEAAFRVWSQTQTDSCGRRNNVATQRK